MRVGPLRASAPACETRPCPPPAPHPPLAVGCFPVPLRPALPSGLHCTEPGARTSACLTLCHLGQWHNLTALLTPTCLRGAAKELRGKPGPPQSREMVTTVTCSRSAVQENGGRLRAHAHAHAATDPSVM